MTTATSSHTDTPLSETDSAGPFVSTTMMGMIAAGLVVLGHLPLLVTYFRRLLLFDHYQFVPLVMIGVPALLVSRCRNIPRTDWRDGFPGRALAISAGTLAVASLFCSPWAAMVSFVLCGGLLLRYYSGSHWRTLLPVWLLLILIIRPPLHMDLALITKLQIETSNVASIVLEDLGVKHLMDGNVLIIPENRFLVEEACSGINSVFALLTAAAFYAVCVHATPLRTLLLLGSSVFWACFMNLVRVAATIFFFEQFEIDIGVGTAHTIAGLVTFSLAILFVAFTDQMVRFFLDPINPQDVEFWKQSHNPFVKLWNRQPPAIQEAAPRFAGDRSAAAFVGTTSVVVAVGLFSLLAAGWQLMALKAEQRSQTAPAVLETLASDSLPSQLGDWSNSGFEIERREKNSILGDISKIWKYQSPTHASIVSVDYPFRGWHPLTVCYRGQGWEIDSHQTAPLKSSDDMQSMRMTEVLMHRLTGERAMLLFVLMDSQGRLLRDPTTESYWRHIAHRVIERLQRPLAGRFPELAPSSGVTTQLQMMIASDGEPIPPETQEQARDQFASIHAHLAGLIRGDGNSTFEESAR